MANVNAVIRVCSSRSAFVFYITLLLITSIVLYHNYVVHELVLSTAGHRQCNLTKHEMKGSRNYTPPWFSLRADYTATIATGRNLYIWHVGALSSRLGNRLFNYAAIFGIAWRNQRIPIWPVYQLPSKKHDITKFFNLRISVDRKNMITNVSLISYYRCTNNDQ